jgi:DNA-binding MarR family transcriptional regulator
MDDDVAAEPADGTIGSIERIERALAELLRVASSPRLHRARQLATGSSISIAEFRFLRRLAGDGAVSVSQAAATLAVSQPTASRTLRQLESAGMVSRTSDDADGRMALYRVTPVGRREQLRLEHYMHGQLEEALADVSPARRAEQAALLEDLVTRLHDGNRGLRTLVESP